MRNPVDTLFSLPQFSILKTIPDRIDFLTHYFLGKPYIANPQGEGEGSEFDQAPPYRFDGFDCVTFVNNVLALALSQNASEFSEKILQLNYYNRIPKFENRFHFMSVDWNPENQKSKIIFDITDKIRDENNTVISKIAEGEIDKPNWFIKKSENETSDRAALLKQYASKFKKTVERVPYLPLTVLFDENNHPRAEIFNQIPHASIIEIVRPNWNLKDKIGTNLHVSHVGFAVRKSAGELVFRHASSEEKHVVEILLSDYLKNFLESTTIKGINIELVCCDVNRDVA